MREDWKNVYAPRDDALERRVQAALRALPADEERRLPMKKAWSLALAAVLALCAAVALAAGLTFSKKVDLKTAASAALAERYGFTPAVESLFHIDVDEDAGVVTYQSGNMLPETIDAGVYTVTVKDGQAEAIWSYDGDERAENVWDARMLAEGLARRAAGEEWFEISGAYEDASGPAIAQEEAVELARRAIEAAYGEDALTGYALFIANAYVDEGEAQEAGLWHYRISYCKESETVLDEYVVRLRGNDGSVEECAHRLIEGQEDEPEFVPAPVPDVPEDVLALAKEAIAQVYALTPEQIDAMALHEYWTYEEGGVWHVWLNLFTGDAWTEGNGVYGADVDAESMTVLDVMYDSTLGGKG